MRAVVCKSFDGPEALAVEEVAEPVAGPGAVIVRVEAAALNFFDTLMARNKYQMMPELPFSPSAEIAGVIEAIGAAVADWRAGQRVAAYLGYGGAREKVSVQASALIEVPDGVSAEVAAGVSVTYGTAMHGLKDRAGLRPGETLAVLGASGGAGLAAVEIGVRLGARVIACASSAKKLAVAAAHGAAIGIEYDAQDLKVALREVTDGKGADVVYDCVGGLYTEPALRSMAWSGRFLVVGFAAGDIPKISLNLVLLKGISLTGVFWGEFVRRSPEAHRAHVAEVLEWVASGVLVPRVHGVYVFDQAREAFEVIARREAMGKVVLVP